MLTDQQRRVRKAIFDSVIEKGDFPSLSELSRHLDQDETHLRSTLLELAGQHEVVLDERGELSMVMPFSASKTPHYVNIEERSWWANCAWDALGITAAMKQDGEIQTECPLTGEVLTLRSGPGGLDPRGVGWVHFVVPAARWWHDIHFT